ncbi:hypothetical protein Pcac1_g4761 [Phytophthora cactorum]|nr:hypothetical protein Pcac1_g4761 [Phytophthora cactorum]
MASQGLRPAQIRVGMARRFGLSEAEMPTLRQVQWFISHYTKKTLHRNDDHEILDQIEQLAYGPEVSDTSPFSNVTSVGSQMSATGLMKNRFWWVCPRSGCCSMQPVTPPCSCSI